MAQKEVKDWITVNHKHIPIYEGESKEDAIKRSMNEESKTKKVDEKDKKVSKKNTKPTEQNKTKTTKTESVKKKVVKKKSVVEQNEDIKQKQIAEAKKEADRLNGKSNERLKSDVRNIKVPDAIDNRFKNSIVNVAEDMHNEFPEVGEIKRIYSGDEWTMGKDVLASIDADGEGTLTLNEELLSDYDKSQQISKRLSGEGWLAGDGSFENSILAHEMAHNLDIQLVPFLKNYVPVKYEPPEEITKERIAKAYSKAFGREIKVGDTVSDIPDYDLDTPFLELGGKKYSYNDFKKIRPTTASNIIVPLAIEKVKSNWKKFGFSKEPTTDELIEQLSGYVYTKYSPDNFRFNTEVFAESYSNYKSFGANANVLAQEVMELTKELYSKVKSRKKAGVEEFYERMEF